MPKTASKPSTYGLINNYRLTDEERDKVERYIGLAVLAVKRDWHEWWMDRYPTFRDAVHTGIVRLIQCIRGWNPEKAGRFEGEEGFRVWAYTYIRYYVREVAMSGGMIRQPKKAKRNAPRVTSFDCPDGVIESAVGVNDPAPDLDVREILDATLKIMSPRCREVVARTFGIEGYQQQTYEEIAADLRVTKQRVQQLHARAMTRMQDYARKTFRRTIVLGAV